MFGLEVIRIKFINELQIWRIIQYHVVKDETIVKIVALK